MRRALVLAGGGAKGAYAFGCLRAFRRCGIRFDAVTGTSVGALNALIWSAGAFREGRRLWSNLSFRSVYPVRSRWWRRMPKPLAWLGGFVHVAGRLIAAGARGTPHQLSKSTNFVIALSAGVAALFGLPALRLSFRCLLALLAAVDIFVALNERHQMKRTWRLTWTIAIMMAYCAISLGLSAYGRPPSELELDYLAVSMGIFLALMGTVLGMIYVLARRSSRAFLDNTPLASSLRAILTTRTLCTTLYATCGVEFRAWDPDKPSYAAMVTGGVPLPGYPCVADRHRRWVPMYFAIHDLPMVDQIKVLLASAALPFGVVPSIEWDGKRLVDGGVADNVPLYPVARADEVFVVLLEPIRGRTMRELGLTPERWTAIDRLYRMLLYPAPSYHMYEPPDPMPKRVIADRPPERFPEVHIFAPRRSIGNFLTGTLNFSGTYARRRMRQGYVDTMSALRDIGIAFRP
jgi:predicted acylesterase/phospholipase RssA